MKTTESIGVIGAGARTALGRSLPASAAAVRARIAHFGSHSFLVDHAREPLKVARATWLPEQLEGSERFVSLAKNALKETLAALIPLDRAFPIRVFVGLPESRPGRPFDLDEAICFALENQVPRGHRVDGVITISTGHAAGIAAIVEARRAIQSGEVDLCVAGGVDSYLEVETLEWLEESGRIHKPSRPFGFTPGEAAGFCLLASPRWLEEHSIEAPLVLLSASSSNENATIHDKAVCVGIGLTQAFEGALAPMRAANERATRMIGDLNGEPYRADELGFAVSRSSDALANLGEVLSPAAFWGDVGAASGGLFAGIAFMASARGADPGNTTLVWAGSESGQRAAAVFLAQQSSP